jgi:glycosyltransferase involved in cell wall biosynthesis
LAQKFPNICVAIQSPPEKVVSEIKKGPYSERIFCLDPTNSDKEIAEFYRMGDVCIHTSRIGESF